MNTLARLSFTPPGTPFYDHVEAEHSSDFHHVSDPLPDGWLREAGPQWVVMHPDGEALPAQGWKVHVAATMSSAERVLDVALPYLVRARWTFKYLRGLSTVLLRNSKYGDRTGSGKFITIYPPDEAALSQCLHELGDLLHGEPGPYLLSDLRWRDGPLYVRYGSFVNRTARSATGEVVHVIEAPDGSLVPDRRGVSFRPPEWVTLPDVLAPAVEARNAGTLDDFPYVVEQALHFSNAGGIYRGRHRDTGESVILREARPHAAEDVMGLDAVGRLAQEEKALRALQGCPGIPVLVERRKGHEHTYLVREYVDGRTLAGVITDNPLTAGAAGAGVDAYRSTVLAILEEVETAVRGMHEHGFVFGDLQPGNVIVDDAGSVTFIDFETAAEADGHQGQAVATPGFVAPKETRGPGVDLFALGCLKLAAFWPVPTVLAWHDDLLDEVVDLVTEVFSLPADFVAGVRADLAAGTPDPRPQPLVAGNPVVEAPAWPRAVDADRREGLAHELAEGILACATPERDDRLFPGDYTTVTVPEGGLDLATGAAGVLWSLHRAGAEVPDEHVDWLEERAFSGRLVRQGLMDGAAGVAWVLDALGRTGSARKLVDRLLETTDPAGDVTYATGLAGIGLTLEHLGRTWGEIGLVERAVQIARGLAERDGTPEAAGLLAGSTGPAMLWSAVAGQPEAVDLRDAATAALARDARTLSALCLAPPAGGRGPDPTSRCTLLTSLSHGGGTALAARRHCDAGGPDPDGELRAFADVVAGWADGPLRPEASLWQGWAGVLVARTGLGRPASPADLGRFRLFSVTMDGRPMIFGGSSLRLSADLSTGAAGVLACLLARPGAEVLPGLVLPSGTG